MAVAVGLCTLIETVAVLVCCIAFAKAFYCQYVAECCVRLLTVLWRSIILLCRVDIVGRQDRLIMFSM